MEGAALHIFNAQNITFLESPFRSRNTNPPYKCYAAPVTTKIDKKTPQYSISGNMCPSETRFLGILVH
jgi:hypothetical protein